MVSEEDVRLINDIAWPLCRSDLARRSALNVFGRNGYPLSGRSFNATTRFRLKILPTQPIIDRRAELSFCSPCRRAAPPVVSATSPAEEPLATLTTHAKALS